MGNYYNDPHKYDDIMDMSHPQPKTGSPASLHDWAGQYAPFAALTGHEEAIEETARLTDKKLTLDETKIAEINNKLAYIAAHLSEKLTISITYFKKDIKKQGGAYLTDIGEVKKIDPVENLVTMTSGIAIKMEDISEISVTRTFS